MERSSSESSGILSRGSPELLLSLKNELAANSLDIVSLNGFPQNDFHQQVVKEKVYLPNWAENDRLSYTIEISNILASATESIFVVTPNSERALDGKLLCEELLKYSVQAVYCPNTETGFQKAISFANENDLICILGSHYVVGELLHFYKKP